MRLIAVDTIGLVAAVVITAASVQDRDAAKPLVWNLSRCWTRIHLAWADAGYTGHKPADWATRLKIHLAAKQQPGGLSVSTYMEPDDPAGSAALRWLDPAMDASTESGAEAVGALYRAQAVGLIRLAYLMLGDRAAAEDVVQDAFCGLYRRWDRLADPSSALPYVRSSVLNGCRTALRRRARGRRVTEYQPPSGSAEAAVLSREEREEVMRAVRQLPDRQREALVLRFYLDLPEPEIARVMGIRPGTVRSATHRALKALGHLLESTS